jgi:hypothetical protein
LAARRFLWIFAILVVLVLASAFAYRLFGPELMRASMVPSVSFEDSPKSPPTFYDRADAWLARPGLPNRDALWTPDGYSPAPVPGVAVFYVHPTTYLKRDRWNAPVELAGDEAFRRDVFLRSQASVFNGIGAVWAPKYRQATFGAFLSLGEPDAAKAFAVAYTDIEGAFQRFLDGVPADQPIVLAGHSQGSLHLVTLMARKIAGRPVAGRIVAAYLIGWPISVERDLPRLGLLPCAAPDDIGCIVAFQSYAEPAEPRHVFEPFLSTTGLDGAPRTGSSLLCTDPLAGSAIGAGADRERQTQKTPPSNDAGKVADAALDRGEASGNEPADDTETLDPLGAARNIGTLMPLDDTYRSARLEPSLVGATCTDAGYLSIGDAAPDLGPYVLPGNNFHVYDYALFWANLRADVERRATTALAARQRKDPAVSGGQPASARTR